jgi:hypothetical protein
MTNKKTTATLKAMATVTLVLFDVDQVVVGVAVYEFVVGVYAGSGGHLVYYYFEGLGGLGQADFL